MVPENDPTPSPTPTPTPTPTPAPTPTPSPTPTPAPAPTPTPSADAEILAATRRRAAELEAERDAERARAQRLQAQVEENERKKLAEDGDYKALAESHKEEAARARADADAALQRANNIQVDSELRIALIRQGVVDPDVSTLVDRSSIRVEGGRVQGLDEAVTAFKTTKPHLFGAVPTLPASTSFGGPQPTPTHDTPPPKDVRNMTQEEYNKHKKETLRGLRSFGGRRR